ncbi:hypothetical protein [Microbacterium maritypicum]
MGDPTPSGGGDYGYLADQIQDLRARIGELARPSGTQRYQSVAKLSALIDNIQAQLDAYNASQYTNAQVDAKDAAVAGQIYPAIAATLAGNVTIGGQFRAPDAVAFQITGTRRTTWIEDATGRFGYAPSTLRMKCAVRPASEERLLALLDVAPKTFFYRDEIRRRTLTRINDGPHAVYKREPRELGLIAEEVDAAGLHEFVIYDADGVPEGIEYSMLVVALQAIVRWLAERIDQQQQRIDRLEQRVAAQQNQIDALTARLDALDGGTP